MFDFLSMKKGSVFMQVMAYRSAVVLRDAGEYFPATRRKIRYPAEHRFTKPLQLNLKTLPLL
jgi:hypothetical protein